MLKNCGTAVRLIAAHAVMHNRSTVGLPYLSWLCIGGGAAVVFQAPDGPKKLDAVIIALPRRRNSRVCTFFIILISSLDISQFALGRFIQSNSHWKK